MSKMRKEYDPNKVTRRKRKPIIYIICEGKETETLISNIFVHGIVWWILYRSHQSTKQLSIW